MQRTFQTSYSVVMLDLEDRAMVVKIAPYNSLMSIWKEPPRWV